MEIDTEANPAPVEDVIVPAEEGATPEPQIEAEGSEPEIDLPELATLEDDIEEVEWEDGNKYKIPKALKPALMKEKDYRQKTMELAEQRKSVETLESQLKTAAQRDQQEFQATVELHNLEAQLQQFGTIDWDAWTDADPVNAQKAWQKYQTALQRRNQVGSALQQHVQQKQLMAQQETAKRREATLQAAAKDIPNWSDQLRDELESFAANLGYDRDYLTTYAEPRDYKVMRLAQIGQQFLDRQRAAAKMKAASAAKAAPEVGGSASSGSSDPSSMSAEEYIEARRAGRI